MRHNMKNYFITLLMALAATTYTVQPVIAATATPQEQKAKEKAKAQAQKEKEKAKAAKEKEKAKAQAAKEKAKAAAAKEKEKAQAAAAKEKEQAQKGSEKLKAQAAKEKEQAQKESEKLKAQSAKEKEQAQRAKEKEKADAERAKIAAARIEKIQKDSAAKAQAEEKQRQAYYKQQAELTNPKETPIHYINLAPRLGYSLFTNKPEGFGTKNIGGVGGGLQLSYMLEYKHLLFETGLAFDILSSASKYNDFMESRYDQTTEATYMYQADGVKESVMAGYASLPVMIGGEWDPFYFLVGVRLNYGAFATYKQSGNYNVTVYDPAYYGGLYNDGSVAVPAADDSKYKLAALDVRAAVELGLDLDKWLQKQPDSKKAKVKPGERYPFGREHVHYKVALFAEYGFLNSNKNTGDRPLIFADNKSVSPTAGHTVMGQSGAKQNNLFVGAKFVIGFEIPGKKPAAVPAPPSYVKVEVQDAETGAPLAGAQAMVENSATHRTVMNKRMTNKPQLQKLPIGEYVLDIQADGYYGQSMAFHIDSIDQTVPMRILMHKIPAPVVEPIIPEVVEPEEVFILKNMYFATNKTDILPISEPAVEELAGYLKRHPEIQITIIGHTDAIGRDKANLKLSRGRAKSVMDALIEHGIEPERLSYDGRGESEPIDTNDTEEGRQNNRRVEVKINTQKTL